MLCCRADYSRNTGSLDASSLLIRSSGGVTDMSSQLSKHQNNEKKHHQSYTKTTKLNEQLAQQKGSKRLGQNKQLIN